MKLTIQEAIEVINKEKICVLTAEHDCDRDCANCKLVMDSDVILEAYDIALDTMQAQKIGKWYYNDSRDAYMCIYTCSECNCKSALKTKYCPHCGSRMEDRNE